MCVLFYDVPCHFLIDISKGGRKEEKQGGSKQGSEQGTKKRTQERIRSEGNSQQGAEQEAKRGNGSMDMESAEKCWAYADARRGILRQRKERHHQGASRKREQMD